MSRYGDDDTADDDRAPVNAACADCGGDYWRSDWDTCVWCGPCAQRRDAWATAQELKTMATAILRSDLTTIKDVA